jgi:hypothetical protein
MFFLGKIPVVLFLLLSVVFTVSAQDADLWKPGNEPSLKDLKAAQIYTAPKDKFTIAMPSVIFSYGQAEHGSREKGRGHITAWHVREGSLSVAHFIFDEPAIAAGEKFDGYIKRVKNSIREDFPTVNFLTASTAVVDGVTVAEVAYLDPEGDKTICRAIPAGNEEYLLTISIKKEIPHAEELITAARDSFKIAVIDSLGHWIIGSLIIN